MKSPGITSWQQVQMAVEEGRQPKLVSRSEGCSNPHPPKLHRQWGARSVSEMCVCGANPLSLGAQLQWVLLCPLLGLELPCELSRGLKKLHTWLQSIS